MSYTTKICEHCGAICQEDDGYCKSCWKKLSTDSAKDDYILDGIGHSEWEDFIDKNADHYMPVYKKNEGKTVFVSMNWSAFLFGLNWVFYRRMYAYGIICYFLSFVLAFVSMFLVALPYTERIEALQEQLIPYEEYIAQGGEHVLYTSDGEAYTPEIVRQGYSVSNELAGIRLSIAGFGLLAYTLGCMLLMGLFGDAVYKAYIKKHIGDSKSGGTSISSMVCGSLLINVIESLVVSPIASLIMLIIAA